MLNTVLRRHYELFRNAGKNGDPVRSSFLFSFFFMFSFALNKTRRVRAFVREFSPTDVTSLSSTAVGFPRERLRRKNLECVRLHAAKTAQYSSENLRRARFLLFKRSTFPGTGDREVSLENRML